MLQPITDIGKNFNAQCLSLAESLREMEGAMASGGKSDKTSNSIQTFFQSIQELPAAIAPLDSRATVLFEIDRALSGTYGAKVFTAEDSLTPTRKLLRDLSAMWQKYFLMSDLQRSAAMNGNIAGTMNFYEDWLKIENVGIEQSEYDRILADVSLMLQTADNLNVPAKVVLFALTGKILMTLGVSDEFAQGRLAIHLDEIRQRDVDTTGLNVAEILLCLQVLHARGKGLEGTGIPEDELRKALRYWSARDDLFDQLFKTWGWLWDLDYTSPLAMGDQIFLKERSALYSSWANATAKMNIGHSFIALAEHKAKNPTLMTVFQPIPIFMFGHSGVGKSSYLTAMSYDAQMRSGKTLTLGRELQAYYESSSEGWRSTSMAPTKGNQAYTFWENLNVASYSTVDYGGQETQPDQWEPQLQELFRNTKGLMFFIEDQDYTDANRLRQKANWFDAILQYWMQSNPHIRHVPISLVLTKCDNVMGEALGSVKRTSLVPRDLQPGIVEVMLPKRFARLSPELETPYGRLKDCILRDRTNNVHPLLQDITTTLLDNFSKFFDRVINLTYHYQIFLTSAAPPRMINDPLFPWGTKEPMLWTIGILEAFHLRESLMKFREEEKQIENDVKIMREDLAQMQHYRDEITSSSAEITRLRQKSTIFQVTMKDRIKYHEENKQRAEADFNTILQRYAKDSSDANKVVGIQAVEREVRKKEETLTAIREKRTDYEARLKGR